jgi:putative component of membrane protein insertase Oxa1/YidC/SpoIIIJ protein YidD
MLIALLLSLSAFSEVGYIEPWGKDSELIAKKSLIPPTPTSRNLLTKVAEQIILFKQNVISPVDGPRSHFRPTSSRYMLLAMRRHGFFKGFIMGCDRLLRENKEEWVYRTIDIDGTTYKWDPTY